MQNPIAPPQVAIIGAALLLLIAFVTGLDRVGDILRDVDWETLLFFVCMFVLVGALEKTGVTGALGSVMGTLSPDTNKTIIPASATKHARRTHGRSMLGRALAASSGIRMRQVERNDNGSIATTIMIANTPPGLRSFRYSVNDSPIELPTMNVAGSQLGSTAQTSWQRTLAI